MSKKQVVSLLVGIIVIFGTCLTALAADFNINASHIYWGFNGYRGDEDTDLGVNANVPARLLDFVKTDHNGDIYTLNILRVSDPGGSVVSYSRADVIGGATFAFPVSDYRVEIEYDTDVVITATAGPGGQIDNDDEYGVEVPYGGDMTFTITPDGGYRIFDVKVDGVSVGAVADYPFTAVEANHTIHAEFVPTSNSGTSNSGESSATLSLKYYENIMDNESDFHVQSGFYRGETATVTERVPTRTGYRFLYWTENSTGWGERYLSGDKLQMDSNANLYANWEKEAASLPEASSPVNVNDNPDTGATTAYSGILLFALGCLVAAVAAKKLEY